MSSAAPTKRDQAPNTLPAGKGVLDWLKPLLSSTVGMKVAVALTALALIGFIIGHMIGHLKMFGGPDAYNAYAHFLKSLGPLLWIARGGILLMFALHIFFTVKLKLRSRAARPIAYQYTQTIQASSASRAMMWLGVFILIFVLLHLAHFTLGYLKGTDALDPSTAVREGDTVVMKTVHANYLDLRDEKDRPDVYAAMVDSFRNPVISILYLLAMFVLFLHLSHGASSVFQTLGLNAPRTQRFYKIAGLLLAIGVPLGYSVVVVAVWTGWIPKHPTYLAGTPYSAVQEKLNTPPEKPRFPILKAE